MLPSAVIPVSLRSEGYTVQNQRASSYEYNVARALESLGYGYIFQYEILGGRRLRGGYIIDFLVFTTPNSTAVFVNGDYWHRNKGLEMEEENFVMSAMRGMISRVVVMWGKDCNTFDAARSFLRRELL